MDFTENAAKETLEQVITEALMKAGSNHSAVRAVCLGISGVNHPTDQELILNWLKRSGSWNPSDYFICKSVFQSLAFWINLILASS